MKFKLKDGYYKIIRTNDNKVVAEGYTNGIIEFELADKVIINDQEQEAKYKIDESTTAEVLEPKQEQQGG